MGNRPKSNRLFRGLKMLVLVPKGLVNEAMVYLDLIEKEETPARDVSVMLKESGIVFIGFKTRLSRNTIAEQLEFHLHSGDYLVVETQEP